jgi:phytoene synthase
VAAAKALKNSRPDPYPDDSGLLRDASVAYCATLFMSPAGKTPAQLLHALHGEISRIPDTCSDPGVARIKLQWWREEIARAGRNEARHPLGKQLQSLPSQANIQAATITRIIETAEQRITPIHPVTEADWREYLDSGAAFPWLLTADLCGYTDTATRRMTAASIRYSVWIEILQTLFPLTQKGHCPIPRERLEHHGLGTNDIIQNLRSDAVRQFLRTEYEDTLAELQRGYESIPAQDRRRQLPVLILNRLSHSLCKSVLKDEAPDPALKHNLTPLRRLLIAWWTRQVNR